MIIKDYTTKSAQSPALDLFILDACEDVFIHAGLHARGHIGDIEKAGVTSVIPSDEVHCENFCRHIDFTRYGVRTRLLVTNHAYICNDQGKTIEKVGT